MADPTCLDIIVGAVIELGARDAEDAMNGGIADWEAERSLSILKAMFREAVDSGLFGRLTEYVATEDYEAEEQQRVFADGFTITLPDEVEDAYTGDTRKPRDLAMIQVVDDGADPQVSVYDAHKAAWARLDNLTLSGTCPLAARNRHGLECALARRLSGTFQKPIPESTAGYASGLSSILSNRRSAPRQATHAEFY